METSRGIPEDAQEEPRILSPQEDADRAARRLAWQEEYQQKRWPEPDDPLRQPGELSPPPAHQHARSFV
jgi:hypothetical protein